MNFKGNTFALIKQGSTKEFFIAFIYIYISFYNVQSIYLNKQPELLRIILIYNDTFSHIQYNVNM